MKKQSGFTLIELMITLSIVGILLTVGVPSLKTFMQSNQLIAASNDLLSALHIARSEAIKLNTRVTICESEDGAVCTIATGNWKNGWIVFVDATGLNLGSNGAACDAGNIGTNCLLRKHNGFTDSLLTVTGVDDDKAIVGRFTFTSRGLPKSVSGSLQSGVYSLCSFDNTVNNEVIDSRAVVLSLSGRVRITDTDKDGVIVCPLTP